MKNSLLVLVGVILGVLGEMVVVDHLKPEGKTRQFVVLVTPSGPVYGEATEFKGDILDQLHQIFGNNTPEEQKEAEIQPNSKPKVPPTPDRNGREVF